MSMLNSFHILRGGDEVRSAGPLIKCHRLRINEFIKRRLNSPVYA